MVDSSALAENEHLVRPCVPYAAPAKAEGMAAEAVAESELVQSNLQTSDRQEHPSSSTFRMAEIVLQLRVVIGAPKSLSIAPSCRMVCI